MKISIKVYVIHLNHYHHHQEHNFHAKYNITKQLLAIKLFKIK